MSDLLSGGEDLLDEIEVDPDDPGSQAADDGEDVLDSIAFDTSSSFQIQAKKFVFQALFEKAANALPQKDILPVLKNFQVEANPGRLRVVATDLELCVISTTEMVIVQEPGSAVFPGKKIMEIIREAEEGDLLLTVSEGTAHIKCGRTEWTVRLMDGSEYPPLPEISEVELHPVNRVKFLGAIQAVHYAAATDTVRPSLMMINVANGKMTASDGVRFQQAELGDDFPLDLQIPIQAVQDLTKLLRTTDLEEIGIGESENHLVFRVGADVFISAKLMAQFPDVEEMILRPALENKDELNCDRQELNDAVKRVRILADPETSAIVLSLKQDKVVVSARDKFGNTATEDIDAAWSHGERDVVVNHQFLTDMLSMADAKSCRFFLGAETKTRKSPLLLKDDETHAVGIINQMRQDWVS